MTENTADIAATENVGTIARTTCGWPREGLVREEVRRYWRDVHSPAISRRLGTYLYRHCHYDPVRSDLFEPVEGVDAEPPSDLQLQWQSDMVYRDQAGVDAFFGSPADPRVTALILGDIEMIVGQSTTYRTVDDNLRTYVDRTGDPVPVGPPATPRYHVYFRERRSEEELRTAVSALARRWSDVEGVTRVRVNLFDKPDMEAEKKAGYPVKTHPVERQYQAYMDLILEDDAVAKDLLGGVDHSAVLSAVHAFPVAAAYTFVYAGVPTLSALRGYPAQELITRFGATHQSDELLLAWMYGDAVAGLERRDG
jgi:hypothetical protein